MDSLLPRLLGGLRQHSLLDSGQNPNDALLLPAELEFCDSEAGRKHSLNPFTTSPLSRFLISA